MDQLKYFLANLISEKRWELRHIVEVGVFKIEQVFFQGAIVDPTYRIQLIEANPFFARQLQDQLKASKHVMVHSVAIHHTQGWVDLCVPDCVLGEHEAASSYVDGFFDSPYLARKRCGHHGEVGRIRVKSERFEKYDDGTIDALVLDIEGGEWIVIQSLISRPKVIIVELSGSCGFENQNREKIESWMELHGYQLRFISEEIHEEIMTPIDYLYVRNG